MTDSQKDLVLHLLRQGQWSDAVDTYSDETGSDIETSRVAVKELAQANNIRQMRWSLVALTFAIACIAVVVVIAEQSLTM